MKYRVVEHSWEQSSIYEGDNPICSVQIDGDVTEDTQDEFEEEMDERAQMICNALNKADLAQSLADALEHLLVSNRYEAIAQARAALANYRKGAE